MPVLKILISTIATTRWRHPVNIAYRLFIVCVRQNNRLRPKYCFQNLPTKSCFAFSGNYFLGEKKFDALNRKMFGGNFVNNLHSRRQYYKTIKKGEIAEGSVFGI